MTPKYSQIVMFYTIALLQSLFRTLDGKLSLSPISPFTSPARSWAPGAPVTSQTSLCPLAMPIHFMRRFFIKEDKLCFMGES